MAAGLPEQEKLLASDGAANDRFDRSVSISGGSVIIANRDDDNGNESGSAYMFGKILCPSADMTGDCFANFKDLAKIVLTKSKDL